MWFTHRKSWGDSAPVQTGGIWFFVRRFEDANMSETGIARLSVGDRVIDTDDDDPSVGVVVARPPEQTISDWEIPTDDGTTTAAEMNPEYPADSQLVIIAFKSALNGYWSKWYEAEPANLFEGVQANGVHHYGFPEGRLTHVNRSADDSQSNESDEHDREDATDEDDESDNDSIPEPPDELLELAERLESNGATVTTDRGGIIIKKLGDEYRITPGGKVEGNGALAENLASLAAEYISSTDTAPRM